MIRVSQEKILFSSSLNWKSDGVLVGVDRRMDRFLSDDEGRGWRGKGGFVCSFLQWSFTILEGKYGRVSSSCAVESCPFAWIPCCKFCRWTEAVYHTRRSGGVSGCSCSCTPYRTCRTEMVSVMNICFSSKNLQFRGRNISIIRSNLRRKQKFKSTFYP